jgi:methylisocitrate lyase
VEAGADYIFAEAVTDPSMYRAFREATGVPILANMTEFGKTPLLTTSELNQNGVDMVLYPLSAFRAMSKAAVQVFQAIRNDGTQADLLPIMQTRAELYEVLDYHSYETKLDELFAKGKEDE